MRQAGNPPFDLHAAKYIVVRYGRKGEQIALYCGDTPSGRVKVKKYRRNSWSWTGYVTVHPSEILRPATEQEIDKIN